jgi:hypothetical protein
MRLIKAGVELCQGQEIEVIFQFENIDVIIHLPKY